MPVQEGLKAWRARLLQWLTVGICYGGWLVGVPSVVLALYEQLWPLVVADLLAMLWVAHLHLRSRASYRGKVLQLLALLYLLGVVLLLTIGYVSQVYLVALPILAVVLLSPRVAVVALALNGVTLLAGGVFIQVDPGMRLLADQPLLRWGAITLNFLLIDGVLTAACAFLLRGMESALQAQQRHAQLLVHHAMHDALTGLANRRLLHDRIAHAVGKAERDQTEVGVLLLDLDRFKDINDSLGHEIGDALIRAVAERLQGAVRAGDTVARLGGDEFVVLLPDVGNETEILAALERVLQAVGGRYHLDRDDLHVSVSVGVAVFPRDGKDATVLLKNADTAMYRAKDGGGGRFRFFQSAMNERLVARMALEAALRDAVERQEFVLHFQPRLHPSGCHSAEALIRWQHPQWGLVSPARFIPVAEESGLIVPIGAWVLQAASRQLAQWQRVFPQLRLSVNLSARDFRDPGLLARVQQAVALLQPGTLEVEVTEGVVMDNTAAAQDLLYQLRALGVAVALDDFGTGFSSLAYLKAFPLDTLKIDQSFVRGLEHDPQDKAIVKTIVDLANNLQLATVAEGVETEAQAQVLRQLGVYELQGFLFAKPLPAQEFVHWLQHHYRPAGCAEVACVG